MFLGQLRMGARQAKNAPLMVRLLNSKLITLHRGMTRGLSECRICTEYDTRIEYDGWVYTLTQVCQRNTCDSRILHGDPCMTREWHERHEDDTDLLPRPTPPEAEAWDHGIDKVSQTKQSWARTLPRHWMTSSCVFKNSFGLTLTAHWWKIWSCC